MTMNRSKSTDKESRFRFLSYWFDFLNKLPNKEHLALFDAISRYGLYGIEPLNLNGDILQYFNKEIRPELNRQRKRRNEGKRL